jgi:DNA-binding NarL/FixJ family response regulator
MAPNDPVAEGYAALETGEWERARGCFQAALVEQKQVGEESAETFEGMGRALWWLKETHASIRYRERAYTHFRRQGDVLKAARIALWLSREYRDALGNYAASNGWFLRAERLLGDVASCPESGWLELARSERASDPAVAEVHATKALRVAAEFRDADLEIRALAQLGLAQVRLGKVEEAMSHFDEAMASATGGEANTPETIGDTCCKMVIACELTLDAERMAQWAKVVNGFMASHDHLPLLAFCGSCCAEMFVAKGRWELAEKELNKALRALQEAGEEVRCVHPAARLAELRILQGRLEEAEQLLGGYEDLPEAVRPAVALHLAHGELEAASALLGRRLKQLGQDTMLSAPLFSLLVEIQLAQKDLPGARKTAGRLGEVALASGQQRLMAEAELAAGRVGVVTGDDSTIGHLEKALEYFSALRMPLQQARTHLELAHAHENDNQQVAVVEARSALAVFEQLGATKEADAAALLLRSLGSGARTGPKGYGVLSKREIEVLRLVGHGLTNAEIAERLYISTKTAGHHVGAILSKLGLRNRSEAAAYAQRSLGEE